MNSLKQNTTGKKQPQGKQAQSSNAFARALVESEKSGSDGFDPNEEKADKLNPLAQALSQTGGSFASNKDSDVDMAAQSAELIKKQKKEALRKKLHDQVNPVETHDIFAAQAERNLHELEAVRQELKMLVTDLADLDKEVDLALTREVVDPGIDGSGFFNFFHKLRQWIMLMREQVHSARTWAGQMSGKGKRGRGSAFSFKKSKNVHASMNSERNFGMNMGA